jgi:predicted acyltransferase
MAEKTQLPSPTPGRVASIDALRGFDMFCITGGERVMRAILRLIPNSRVGALARQFSHVPWEGFHFHDLIFPLFLFVVGAVLPFSLTRRLESGAKRAPLYRHIVRRLVLLFVLGLVYNGLLDFRFHDLRLPGVLQRIAICYFVAALLVLSMSIRGQAAVAGGILVVYWAVMKLVPVPGVGAGVITPDGNLAGYVDRLIIPRPYCCYAFGDNEGLLSTFPAIATTLLGVLAGHWLRSRQAPQRKVLGLAGAGVLSLLVGAVWGHWFPIIKNVWTSSYVVWAGGWSLLLLALFYWIIDVRGYKRWSFFFAVVGMNPITIYLAWHLFDFGTVTRIFVHGFIDYCGPLRPLVWEFAVMMTGWLFLWFLHRQKIYLRV